MFNEKKKEGLRQVGGAFKPPSNPLHHSLIVKGRQIPKPSQIVKTIGGLGKVIDAFTAEEIQKALELDPKKIKVKPLKSDGYDEEYLCIGVGSKQYSGRHILFLDLDGNTKEQAERVAKSLISSVACSDCYIIRSSKGNHHLVCLDMFSFMEVQKIAREFGHDQWAKFRGSAKDFVLRIGPKMKVMRRERPDGDVSVFLEEVDGTRPMLVSIINSPFKYRAKSNSMRRIFSSVWGHNIKKDSGFTDSTMFRFHCYRVRLKKNKDGVDKQVKFEEKANLNPAVKKLSGAK
jgi:hypothetical protein